MMKDGINKTVQSTSHLSVHMAVPCGLFGESHCEYPEPELNSVQSK